MSPIPIMAGDHITTILAGGCMVAKVIKCTTRAQCTDGTTESHDTAWGEETDKRRALSATEDEFSSTLKHGHLTY